MGLDLFVVGQIDSFIKLRMNMMLALENRYLFRNSSSVISSKGLALSLTFFSFLCLPKCTNAMLAAILFRTNDWLNSLIHLLDLD